MQAGAQRFLVKGAAPEELKTAIERIAAANRSQPPVAGRREIN